MRPGGPRTIKALCLLVFAAALSACGGPRPPSFRTTGAQLARGNDGSSLLILRIEARNHAEDPLPLRRVAYTVSLAGSSAFTGERSPEVTLPAFGTQTFELPCVFEGPPPAAGSAYTVSGTVWYEEPGRVAEALRDYRVRVPEAQFNLEGQVGQP